MNADTPGDELDRSQFGDTRALTVEYANMTDAQKRMDESDSGCTMATHHTATFACCAKGQETTRYLSTGSNSLMACVTPNKTGCGFEGCIIDRRC